MSFNLLFGADGAAGTADILIAVALVLLTVFVFLTAVWLLTRTIYRERGVTPFKPLLLILVAGVVIRTAFALTITGFRAEISELNEITGRLFGSVTGYYAGGTAEIYPISFYILGLFGGIAKGMGLDNTSVFAAAFYKIPLILADLATAILLYRIAHKHMNEYVGLVICGLFCVCPAFFVASGIWGSYLCLLLPVLILSLYMLVTKRPLLSIVLYSVCLIISFQAAYLYPAYLLYYGYQFIRSLKRNIKEKPTVLDAVKDAELSLCYKLPVYFIGAFLFKYLVSIQFAVADFSANPFVFMYGMFLKPLVNITHYSKNGISVYNLFNRVAIDAAAFNRIIHLFVIGFAVLMFVIGGIVYISKKNRAVLVLYTAFIPYTLVTFYLGFSTMSYLLVPVLLLFAFILIKDRRILQVMFVTAFCFAAVSMTVMAAFGQMNGDAELAGAGYLYLQDAGGFGLAALIIASVLSAVAYIYMMLILLDVSLSNTRKLLTGYPAIGYFDGIKRLFKEEK